MSKTDNTLSQGEALYDEFYERRAEKVDSFNMTVAHLLAFVDCNTDIELNLKSIKICGKCYDIYEEFIAADYFITNIKAKGGKIIIDAIAPWDFESEEQQEDL